MNLTAEDIRRLQAKLSPQGECLVYTGTRIPSGYGYQWVPGERTKIGTHRIAWVAANGSIPDGLWVLHHCDNPPCCNVNHLFLGSQADNNADMWSKGRGIAVVSVAALQRTKTHCPQGHSYDGPNLYVSPSGDRRCRTCKREVDRKRRAAR